MDVLRSTRLAIALTFQFADLFLELFEATAMNDDRRPRGRTDFGVWVRRGGRCRGERGSLRCDLYFE